MRPPDRCPTGASSGPSIRVTCQCEAVANGLLKASPTRQSLNWRLQTPSGAQIGPFYDVGAKAQRRGVAGSVSSIVTQSLTTWFAIPANEPHR